MLKHQTTAVTVDQDEDPWTTMAYWPTPAELAEEAAHWAMEGARHEAAEAEIERFLAEHEDDDPEPDPSPPAARIAALEAERGMLTAYVPVSFRTLSLTAMEGAGTVPVAWDRWRAITRQIEALEAPRQAMAA